MDYSYRVFISYARKDRELCNRVAEILAEYGLIVLSDKGIVPGDQFPDEIRRLISEAHVLMPIITPDAEGSAWVNQEIGYALALAVPIIALCVNVQAPEGMLRIIQSIATAPDLLTLREELAEGLFERKIEAQSLPQRPIEIVDWAEERSKRIAAHANKLWAVGTTAASVIAVCSQPSAFRIKRIWIILCGRTVVLPRR